MKELQFSNTYFKKKILDDTEARIRVVIKENSCIEMSEEEYSLRITTRYEDPKTVHREWAIEHHLPPAKHSFPHLQFKFHSEGVGQFRLRIDIANNDEYSKVILGFIYQIKNILNDMEKFREGITQEMLVLELVDELKKESYFLDEKIRNGLKKYSVEFDRGYSYQNFGRLTNNPILKNFLGKDNLELIEDIYTDKQMSNKERK